MKNLLKTIAIAVALTVVFVSNTFADDKEAKKPTFATGIFASKSGEIHVGIDKYTNSVATILVTDASGKSIYRKQVGKHISKIRFHFDTNPLPAGVYIIEVFSGSHKETRKFEIQEQIKTHSISLL